MIEPFRVAIVDLRLEELQLFLIAILAMVAIGAWVTIGRLQLALKDQKRQLQEQADLNGKLSKAVDRVLRIDANGSIDQE